MNEPVFNVPGAVVAFLGLIAAVHAALAFGPIDMSDWLIQALAFNPARYTDSSASIPGGPVAAVASFVTHIFVHADLTHLLINGAWFLAFGSVIARRVGGLRFIAFMLACGIAGALLFLVLRPGANVDVVGASGGIAGLMGGVMRFLFSALDRRQGNLLREDPARIPLMPLAAVLSDRRVVVASVIFLALNVLAIWGVGTLGENVAIAWEAHVGGYMFGLLAFGLFDVAPPKALPSQGNFD